MFYGKSYDDEETNPPDSLLFMEQGRYPGSYKNHGLKTDETIERTSAVYKWDSSILYSGEKRTYTVYYGLCDLNEYVTRDLEPLLAVSVFADSTAERTDDGFKPINVTAYIKNIGDAAAKNVSIRIKESSDKLMSVSAPADSGYIKEKRTAVLDVGERDKASWTIDLEKWLSEGDYSFEIICTGEGFDEKTIKRTIHVPYTSNQDNRIQWKRDIYFEYPLDTFSFTNSYECFFDESDKEAGTDKYNMLNEDFKFLYQGLEHRPYLDLLDYLNSDWRGSCYGMSSLVQLSKMNIIKTKDIENDKYTMSDISYPQKNTEVESLINFYQLSSALPDAIHQRNIYIKNEADNNLKKLVEEAKKVKHGGSPINLSIEYIIPYTEEKIAKSIEDYKNILENNKSWFSNLYGFRTFSEIEIGSLRNIGDKIAIDLIHNPFEVSTVYIRFSEDGSEMTLYRLKSREEIQKSTYICVKSEAHSIVAYDVDENVYENDGFDKYTDREVTGFKYRVHIADPNKTHSTFLYIKEDYSDWYYDGINILEDRYVNATKFKPFLKRIILLNSATEIDWKNPITKTDNTILKTYDEDFIINNNIIPILISNGRGEKSEINCFQTEGDLDVNISTIPGGTSKQTIFLPEGENEYTYEPISGCADADYNMFIGSYSFKVVSDGMKKATGYRNGRIEFNNCKGNYKFGIGFDSNVDCDLSWFGIYAIGSGENVLEMKIISDGALLSSKDLQDIIVEGINYDGNVTATFSTDYPSVKFMAVDEDTLGVYVDTDSDGTYETIIADSDGTEYGDSTKPEKPQEGSETAQTSAQQTSTVQPQSQPEQQSAGTVNVSRTEQSEPQASPAAETVQQSSEPVASADYGFVPWVGGALLAAVIAAAVVVMVRKRKDT